MYNIVNKTLKTKSGDKRYCIHVLYHQDVKVTCLNKGIGILHSLGYIESLNSRSLSFSFLSACQEEGASFSRLVPSSHVNHFNPFRYFLSSLEEARVSLWKHVAVAPTPHTKQCWTSGEIPGTSLEHCMWGGGGAIRKKKLCFVWGVRKCSRSANLFIYFF